MSLSGCVSKGFVCKKQEVINLGCLELTRQKHCSDLDITLMVSDMVMSNMLTSFRGEQTGNDELWPRLSEASFFLEVWRLEKAGQEPGAPLLLPAHVQQGGGEQLLLTVPRTKGCECLKQLLGREQGHSCPHLLGGMNTTQFYSSQQPLHF